MTKIKVVVRKVNNDFIECNYDTLTASLYKERKYAIKKFKSKQAAYTSIAAGRLLQDVVGREMGITPEEISIGRGPNGKPYIIGYENFKYNLSHSGEYVVLAYGFKEVGIDVEHVRSISATADESETADYIRRSERDLDVAGRFFCDNELEYIMTAGKDWYDDINGYISSERNVNFTLTWTMKESYVKLKGYGISVPLKSFEIDYSAHRVKNEDAFYEYWQLDNYILCVCTEEPANIEFRFEKEWVTCLLKED